MLKFSEILNFLGKIPILKEFEWFEWFGPSPIEPFNSGCRWSAAWQAAADAGAPRCAATPCRAAVVVVASAGEDGSPRVSGLG